jgi:CHAD domain-containing protein
MLQKKRLRKYLNKRWKGLKNELKTLKKCPDNDALHELRLSAKKIKAIVSLLKSTGKKYKLSTKQIKPLFQQAGAIRSAKLNLKTIRDNHINNRTLQLFLTDIVNYEYQDLSSKYKCYVKTIKSLRKKFDDAVGSVTDKDVKKYYKKNISRLSISFLWPIDIQTLHDNRKIIKNLLYINKVLPPSIRKSIRLDVKYLDQLQEKIGLWHDFDITRDLLNKHGLVHIAGYASLFCQQMSILECVKKDVDFFGNKVALKK